MLTFAKGRLTVVVMQERMIEVQMMPVALTRSLARKAKDGMLFHVSETMIDTVDCGRGNACESERTSLKSWYFVVFGRRVPTIE